MSGAYSQKPEAEIHHQSIAGQTPLQTNDHSQSIYSLILGDII